MKDVVFYAGVLIVFVALSYGGYLIKRWFNYEFGYEEQVVEEICKQVKHEYLVDPSICK